MAKRSAQRGRSTYSGAIPNIKAEKNTDMTPKKNESFSLVRTTFVECHVEESFVNRCWTYATRRETPPVASITTQFWMQDNLTQTLSLNFCISRSRFSARSSPAGVFILFIASSARILRRSLCFVRVRWMRSMRASKNVSTVSTPEG